MKRSGILIAAGMIACLVLGGCSGAGSSSEPAQTAAAESGQEMPVEASDTSDMMEEDMVVSTAFGDLHYDGQWKDSLETQETENGDRTEIEFTAKMDSGTYPLFKVTIGGEDGEPVGTLTGEDGTVRNVYIEPYDPENLDQMSEEEQNRFYAMKDSINYLIDNLK